MIKKELFVETINFIQSYHDQVKQMNETDSNPELSTIVSIYCVTVRQMIKLLSASFNYDDALIDEYIYYYCFHMDFGRKDMRASVIVDKRMIEIKTPEGLYDFLFEEACSYEEGFKRQ